MNRQKNNNKGSVALGLSGGVDSAVAAHLLKKAGYKVTGVYIVCWDEGPECRARIDRADAVRVAMELGIPVKVLDFQKEYKERVIDRFYDDYKKGLTPNPDVWCNSEIKFGMFYDWAMKEGFDFVATGHYAAIREGSLAIPRDEHKDQTYFLNSLRKEQLQHILFPLAEMTKAEVRELAGKLKLSVAEKKDSVGICFVGDVDVRQFLGRRFKEEVGEVVDVDGKLIGHHKGVWFYTIGQRGGFEFTPEYQKKFGGAVPPFYVVEKRAESNQLVCGFGAETYRDHFVVANVNFLVDGEKWDKDRIRTRIRHTGELLPGKIEICGEEVVVYLREGQRGVAPGQAAVFYQDGIVMGGGVIK